jgi:hypothetical protein
MSLWERSVAALSCWILDREFRKQPDQRSTFSVVPFHWQISAGFRAHLLSAAKRMVFLS